MANVLRVKKWEDFQHYRDRDPVWIKLYGRLLDDADFLALPEAAQGQLVKLWLVASRCRNQIRDDPTFLRFAMHTKRLYVDELVAGGFLERVASETLAEPEQNASNSLAPCEQDASPRALAREETEKNNPRGGKAAPWMGEVRSLWVGRFDADPPTSAPKVLRPLVAAHGIATVIQHLGYWLDRTDPKYLNLHRFAATFGEWAPKAPRGANGLNIPDASVFDRLGI